MGNVFPIPDNLVKINTEMRGPEGIAWLKRLPVILADCERRWSLTIGPPFPLLSYNYAALASRTDGTKLVVKVCFPGSEFGAEVDALELYAGRGSVQLLDYNLEQAIMLLEHLEPGTLLYQVKDDVAATSIAAGVMKQLWRPVPANHSFVSVADWGKGFSRLRKEFGGTSGPFPENLVDQAERLFAELLGSMDEPVVLHGDLHHFNILAAQRQPWLAIDPKGVVGEPAYEIGALLRNPMPDIFSMPHLDRLQARRLDQLSEELGFDRQRLRAWGFAQAVLSSWWSYEDHDDDWESGLVVARSLSEIKPR